MVLQLIKLTERRKSALLVIFSSMAAFFTVVGVIRHDLFSLPGLATNKDGLSALQSVVTMTTIIGAAVVSYYRFFRGRTFSMRADLSITCKVLPFDDANFLHAVTLTVRNVGTMAIWSPTPQMRVELEGNGSNHSFEITHWLDDRMTNDPDTKCVIDAGETAMFFLRHAFEKSVPTVTYVASITSEDGDSWIMGASFANQIKSD